MSTYFVCCVCDVCCFSLINKWKLSIWSIYCIWLVVWRLQVLDNEYMNECKIYTLRQLTTDYIDDDDDKREDCDVSFSLAAHNTQYSRYKCSSFCLLLSKFILSSFAFCTHNIQHIHGNLPMEIEVLHCVYYAFALYIETYRIETTGKISDFY